MGSDEETGDTEMRWDLMGWIFGIVRDELRWTIHEFQLRVLHSFMHEMDQVMYMGTLVRPARRTAHP